MNAQEWARRFNLRAAIEFLRFALAMMPLSIAGLGFWRHNMTEIVPGYRYFDAIGSTTAWSAVAAIIGVGLLLLPRGSVVLLLWQFFSASLFIVFAVLASVVYGPIWGTVAYLFPASLSFLVMWYSAQDWAGRHGWYRHAQRQVQGRGHG